MTAMTSMTSAPTTTRGRLFSRTRLLTWAIVLLSIAAVVLLWPARFGGATTWIIVTGNSMEPTYRAGDIVMVRSVGAPEVGDVAVFAVPDGVGSGSLVIHRVVGERPDGSYIMQGDNRNTVDEWRVGRSDVVGRPLLRLPGLGNAALQLSGGSFTAPSIGLAVTLLLWPRRKEVGGRSDEPHGDDDPTVVLERVEPVTTPTAWRPQITAEQMQAARDWLEQELERVERTRRSPEQLPMRHRPRPTGRREPALHS